MGKSIDLTNQTFGKWTVIEKDQTVHKNNQAYWLCKCSCGNPEIRSVSGGHLRNGASKSCGKCYQFEMIGKKFGHLTVLEVDLDYKREHNVRASSTFFKVQCDCESKTNFVVNGRSLVDGSCRSCGCLQKKLLAQRSSIDLTNKIIGTFKALEPTEEREGKHVIWRCKCIKCGQERKISTGRFNINHIPLCVCCEGTLSKGEIEIINILKENNIKFEKEKTFKDLKNTETQGNYRYDFYLPDYNRLIEFDGEQHFRITGWYSDEKKLKARQKADTIKNKYALDHGFELIHIPYWQRGKITLDFLLGNKYLIKKGDIIYEE